MTTNNPEPDIILILAGQSNMAGRGPVSDSSYTEMISSFPFSVRDRTCVYLNDAWRARPDEPLHNDKPDKVGVGPGLAAALIIARAFPELHVGLIPTAFGGSEIQRWLPDGDLFRSCATLVEKALASTLTKEPKCIVMWHQVSLYS
jgi:hypothetical protein